MNKLSSVALSAFLVAAGVGASLSAEAHPYVTADVACPDGVVVERVGYARPYYGVSFGPYYDTHGRAWRREFERDRYDRFHRGYRGHR
jgi:hypothetical protein